MNLIDCPACWGTGSETDIIGDPCRRCLGSGHVEDYQFTPHFAFSELVRAHKGIHNWPPDDALARIGSLCRDLLEPVRAVVGPLQVTSGYRCQALDCRADAGNPRWLHEFSGHSWGGAADVGPMLFGVSLADVVDAAMRVPAWDQLILEGGCAHLALFCPTSNAQRKQVMVRVPNPARQSDPHAVAYCYENYRPGDSNQFNRIT